MLTHDGITPRHKIATSGHIRGQQNTGPWFSPVVTMFLVPNAPQQGRLRLLHIAATLVHKGVDLQSKLDAVDPRFCFRRALTSDLTRKFAIYIQFDGNLCRLPKQTRIRILLWDIGSRHGTALLQIWNAASAWAAACCPAWFGLSSRAESEHSKG